MITEADEDRGMQGGLRDPHHRLASFVPSLHTTCKGRRRARAIGRFEKAHAQKSAEHEEANGKYPRIALQISLQYMHTLGTILR